MHIASGSIVVGVGDRVVAGQRLCASGAAGFCPEPHLHVNLNGSAEPEAPSLQLTYAPEAGGEPVAFEAGRWYSAAGVAPNRPIPPPPPPRWLFDPESARHVRAPPPPGGGSGGGGSGGGGGGGGGAGGSADVCASGGGSVGFTREPPPKAFRKKRPKKKTVTNGDGAAAVAERSGSSGVIGDGALDVGNLGARGGAAPPAASAASATPSTDCSAFHFGFDFGGALEQAATPLPRSSD